MGIVLDYYDITDESHTHIVIEGPTVDQIASALQSRHHRKQSKILLYSRSKSIDSPDRYADALDISRCTRERYKVQHNHFPSGRGVCSRCLIDKQAHPKQYPVRYRSDNGEIFMEAFKETVDYDTALRVALYFAETDSLPDDLTWGRPF